MFSSCRETSGADSPSPAGPAPVLSQEENSLGRFLKEQGKEDKTRAGKMMVAVGKTMSYTAQQRLALRAPLLRLHQVRPAHWPGWPGLNSESAILQLTTKSSPRPP